MSDHRRRPHVDALESATLRGLAGRLYEALSPYRRGVALGVYCLTTVGAYALAYLLRFELTWPTQLTGTFAVTLPILLLVRIGGVGVMKLTLGRWRYVDIRDVVRLLIATTGGSLVFFLILMLLPTEMAVPRSVIALEWILTSYVTAGVWMAYRLAWETLRRPNGRNGGHDEGKRRALIVGAGEAGSLIAREMLRNSADYEPVGFLDDDSFKWGVRIHGIEVLGRVAEAESIAAHLEADEMVIAIPSAEPAELRRVVDACEVTGLTTKVLPGIADVIQSGRVNLSQLRDIQIEDLLGREPVRLELPELAQELAGKTVLVTGAAGSIGSELSRQIALHQPDQLILLDQSESDLYYLELELQEAHPDLDFVPVVGDVLDQEGLRQLFGRYRPDRVFHAAAYKHVPLMELNVREAIRNNVLGTLLLAEVAGESGTEEFVLISTDKAVNPASVMGATKRVAELILHAMMARYPETWYVAVRFGNVLGSRGSVIPIFKRQLREGKALTVTHPEVRRYFMTIPEAVQLVLQASLLDESRGQVLMLDMGDPVKIVDLARQLIRLAGYEEGVDAHLEFIGLRPGEKLSEELCGNGERSAPTAVEKVRVLVDSDMDISGGDLLVMVDSLEWRLDVESNEELAERLSRLLPEAEAANFKGELVGDSLMVVGEQD